MPKFMIGCGLCAVLAGLFVPVGFEFVALLVAGGIVAMGVGGGLRRQR